MQRELDEKSVVAFFATTASDGKIYQVAYYNLDMIISVGYRVKSQRGVQFRQWATKVLNNYLKYGYAISSRFERLEIGASLKDAGKRLFAFTQMNAAQINTIKNNL